MHTPPPAEHAGALRHKLPRIRMPLVIAGVTTITGLILLCWPPLELPTAQGRAAGMAIIAIGLWATSQLPEHLTALLFFLLAMLVGVAPSSVIFSGFSSSAFWMVFAGLVIALGAKSSGLSERLAHSIALKLNGSYLSLISGVMLVGVLLGFLMPSSMGRVVLLVPVILALAESFGFAAGSNGRIGVLLAATFGSFVPTFAILPANVPNMILVGTSETLFGIAPLYGEYLLLHFPVLGLLKSVVIVGLIVWRFPDRPKPYTGRTDSSSPLSRIEWKMAGILLLALTFWLTDFVHHISPAWIALSAAMLLLLPRIGLISAQQFSNDINYSPLFFIAGVLGMGALISHSGLGARAATQLATILPLEPGNNLLNYTSLAFISLVTGIATTQPGVPAVLTPLADQIALASGLPIKTVLMTQVLGFSTTLLLFQAPPLVIAMRLSGENTRPAIVLALLLALVTIVLLLPLDYLWWRLLGWL